MSRLLPQLALVLAAAGQTPAQFGSVQHESAAAANQTVTQALLEGLDTQLHNQDFQYLNGIAALCLGAVLLYDGLHFFKLGCLVVVGWATYLSSSLDLSEHFHESAPVLWMKILALELALLVAYICGEKRDFEGVKKLLGIGLGIWAFSYVQFRMVSMEGYYESAAKNELFATLLGTVCVGGGFYMLAEGPSYIIALLSPACGSILVSSGAWFLITLCDLLSKPGHFQKIYWVDFFKGMYPHNEAPGLFKGDFDGLSFNKLASVGLAFVLFVISACVQVSRAKKERRELKSKANFMADVCDFVCCAPVNKDRKSASDL